MKTYDMENQSEPYTGQHEGIAAIESGDGEWVPADVAQRLYEVLKAMVDYADDVDPCFPGLGKARAALAAADGEEV